MACGEGWAVRARPGHGGGCARARTARSCARAAGLSSAGSSRPPPPLHRTTPRHRRKTVLRASPPFPTPRQAPPPPPLASGGGASRTGRRPVGGCGQRGRRGSPRIPAGCPPAVETGGTGSSPQGVASPPLICPVCISACTLCSHAQTSGAGGPVTAAAATAAPAPAVPANSCGEAAIHMLPLPPPSYRSPLEGFSSHSGSGVVSLREGHAEAPLGGGVCARVSAAGTTTAWGTVEGLWRLLDGTPLRPRRRAWPVVAVNPAGGGGAL